jgi:hypothetical protein
MAESIIQYTKAVQEMLLDNEAEFSFVPDFSLPDMRIKRCVVVPMGIEQKIVSRLSVERNFRIDVALLHKIKTDAEIEKLLTDLELISTKLLSKKILSGLCVKADFAPMYSPEMIMEKNLFVGVISLTVKVV